ncbi:MAG TPA: biotin/lipoyl-binding protein, partial [Cyclobacteriaceae bacterium]|nr:biotin/lipoyl-binding protein [Cyclobacteriaceae bacterium]
MFETNEIYFIRIFFRILLSFFVVIAVSVFVFRINDSVIFQNGEILSENPQLDYKATFEAISDKVYVKEGQTVKAGDTLMVLHSEQLRKDYTDAQVSVVSLQQTAKSISALESNTYDKIRNLQHEKDLNIRTHGSQKEKLRVELKSASDKAALASEQMSNVGLTKLRIDSTLYRQNVISKLDITNS